MGLDAVELVMQVEDSFGIDIPDHDAAQLITVGQLYDYVRRRVGRDGMCLTRHVFYRLRSAVGVRCRPRDSLALILPQDQLAWHWEHVARSTALVLPPLRRPEWVESTQVLLGLVGATGATLTLGLSHMLLGCAWLLATAGAILILWVLTSPSRIPRNCRTVGELTRVVAIDNAGWLSAELGWTDRDIWKALVAMISEQMAILPDQITPEKEFVRDLGMG